MNAWLSAGLLILCHATTLAAQGGTELYLVRIQQSNGQLTADSVVRLTERPGYDNQPAFVPGTRAIFYTSIDSTGRADIWRYDLDTRSSVPATRTIPESEYSATPIPRSDRFSVVRVEADSTQRLWSFDRGGANPRLLLADLKPVGYHAWLDDQHLIAFVLGTPATLQFVDVRTGASRTIATNIGRALQRVPGRNAFSFIQRNADTTSTIVMYDVGSGRKQGVINTLAQNEYHLWLKDGTLISANGSVLYQWRPGDRGWVYLRDLAAAGIAGITRLALSEDERLLIIVTAEP